VPHPGAAVTEPAPRAAPIGLLGGSFDPVHVGHLALARAACEQLDLAQVRFVPAGQPWQKGGITDAAHRARMVLLAIAGEARFILDLREVERAGPSYTIDTLRELRAQLGAEVPLVLLIGSDQLERLDTWRDWRALLDCAHIAVARRNDAVLVLSEALQTYYNEHWAPRAALARRAAGCIAEFDMPPVAASATRIRTLLRQPASRERDAELAAWLPADVLDYIRRNGLYA
jgi:nicotinate-nucleotide adenylyltransferase